MKIIENARSRMEKTLTLLQEQFVTIHGGGVSAALIDTIKVECYGSQSPIQQVAQVISPVPNKITVRPHDASITKAVEHAIQKANLGCSCYSDKHGVHITVSPLSGEQRERATNHLRKLAENSKVAIRNVRKDSRNDIDKYEKRPGKEIPSEDEIESLKKELQGLTDLYITKVDDLAEAKVKLLKGS